MHLQRNLIEYDAHERILRATDAIHRRSILYGKAQAEQGKYLDKMFHPDTTPEEYKDHSAKRNQAIDVGLKHSDKIHDSKSRVIRAIHKLQMDKLKSEAAKSKRWWH